MAQDALMQIAPATMTDSLWWPTPIVVAHYPDVDELNDQLKAIILEKEREIKASETPQAIAGVDQGLTAYWTKYNVLNWPYPACEQLAGMFVRAVDTFIARFADPKDPGHEITGISCWANVLRPGESLDIHHHDPGYISAHYIVKSGRREGVGQPESGSTVYYRPGFLERSQGDVFGGPWDADWRFSVPPVDGTLTVFPSYVRHEVRTHAGPGERITVALDVYIKKQQIPFYFAPPRWYVPPRDRHRE